MVGNRSRRLAASLLAAFAPAVAAGSAQAETVVGVAANLTGGDSFAGDQIIAGVGQAIDRLNADGGLLGEQLRFVSVDDGCDANRAAAAAAYLIEQEVSLVVGHSCSGTSIAASPIYGEAGVTMISPSATNTRVTDEGGPHVFRVIGRDDAQGAVAARHIHAAHPGAKIAIVNDSTPYGLGLAGETRAELERLGITDIVEEAIERDGDITGLLEALKESGADVVYLGGDAPDAGLLMQLAADEGIELSLVSGDTLGAEEFWLVAGEAGQGARFTFPPDPRRHPAAEDAVAAFREQGREPLGYTLHALAAVEAWAEAVRRNGSFDADGVQVELAGGTFETALGEIGFDEKGDVKGAETFAIFEWKDGEYVQLEGGSPAN